MLPIGLCAVVTIAAACREGGPRTTDSIATEDRAPGAVPAPTIVLPIRALGTEPFWALDIDSAGLRFRTPDDTTGRQFPPIAAAVVSDTVIWARAMERASVDVRIWRERCSDGMSDRVYPFTATVRIENTTYRGCADARSAIVGSPTPP